MKQDRFLTAILIGVLVLVVAAIGLFLFRGGETGYLENNSPEAVVLNYVYALQQGDYERAYQYLPEEYNGQSKPEFNEFRSYFNHNQLTSQGISILSIEEQADITWVMVETVQSSGGIFGGIYRSQETAQLIHDLSGDWKIIYMPYQFWGWEWFDDVQVYR